METYELLYLAPLQQAEADRATIREQVTKLVEAGGGSVTATRDIARQRLSFPIKRQEAGEYTLVEFTASGAMVKGIERELRLLPSILRCMVTTKSERARSVGHEIEALERMKAQADAAKAAAAERAATTVSEPPQVIEDLDKKLEEILGKDMI